MLESKALKTCARNYPHWAGFIAASIGQLAVVSWFAHWRTVLQLIPSSGPIAYNMALCVDAAGIGLLLLTTRWASYARIPGIAMILTGSATLLEYVSGSDYAIDHIFFTPYFNAFHAFAGRMSPLAATCVVLVGCSLTQMAWSPHRFRFISAGIISCVVSVISLVAIVGYAARLDAANGWGSYSRMALMTATALVIVGTGMLALAARQAPQRNRGFIRWLPVTASMTLMLMIAFVSALNRADLERSTFWRRHTFDVILEAQSFEETIVETQRGLRAYVASGDLTALASLNAAVAREPRLLGSLVGLTADNPLQQARLYELGAAMKDVLTFDAVLLNTYKSGGLAAFNRVDAKGDGRILTGRARTELKAFSLEERRLLDLRDATEQRDSNNSGRLLVLGSSMAAVLLVVAYCAIALEMRRRHTAEIEREVLIGELKHALAEVRSLSGMIPICGWCKSIRTDDGYWQTVEQYVCTHTEATFAHGVCPDCAVKLEANVKEPPKAVARTVVRHTVQARGA